MELSPEQVRFILDELRKMRHDVNNHLAVIMASAELIRQRPEMADKMLESLASKPTCISASIKAFSAEMEKLFQQPKPANPSTPQQVGTPS